MDQLSITDYMTDLTNDREGNLRPAPKWMDKERCENCKHWRILEVIDQPLEGWGVKGICSGNCLGSFTNKNSYCQEFEGRW